ncbi:MAG: HPr family phosphocarrier protein [Clostridia bacterium]|nr:HPr family phosphocarrier protein [Clostridia bacterium]
MLHNLTTTQHRYHIELVTVSDIRKFVAIAGKCEGKVLLSVSDTFCINAKSLLGVMLAKNMDWNHLVLLTEKDYYEEFKQFMAE